LPTGTYRDVSREINMWDVGSRRRSRPVLRAFGLFPHVSPPPPPTRPFHPKSGTVLNFQTSSPWRAGTRLPNLAAPFEPAPNEDQVVDNQRSHAEEVTLIWTAIWRLQSSCRFEHSSPRVPSSSPAHYLAILDRGTIAGHHHLARLRLPLVIAETLHVAPLRAPYSGRVVA